MKIRLIAVLVLLVVSHVMGCASRQIEDVGTSSRITKGAVGAEAIVAPPEARYEVVEDVDYLLPQPSVLNAMPDYPPQLLEKNLAPVQMTVRLVVDAQGLVERAEILESTTSEEAFSEAVLESVKTWTFSPLTRVKSMVAEPLPYTQGYRFTFRQVDGRAIVESARHK